MVKSTFSLLQSLTASIYLKGYQICHYKYLGEIGWFFLRPHLWFLWRWAVFKHGECYLFCDVCGCQCCLYLYYTIFWKLRYHVYRELFAVYICIPFMVTCFAQSEYGVCCFLSVNLPKLLQPLTKIIKTLNCLCRVKWFTTWFY